MFSALLRWCIFCCVFCPTQVVYFLLCILPYSGGCREQLRPASVLRCDPPCRVASSDCVDTNVCGCLGLLQPVYSANRTLIDCTMNASSTTPGPTASVEPGELSVSNTNNRRVKRKPHEQPHEQQVN